MSAPTYTCTFCGAQVAPFQMPPHSCPGVVARVQADLDRRTPLPLPRLERSPMVAGDIVRFTLRAAQGRHERLEGVVSRLVDNGKTVLVRVGNTLHELNMGQLSRVGHSTRETAR